MTDHPPPANWPYGPFLSQLTVEPGTEPRRSDPSKDDEPSPRRPKAILPSPRRAPDDDADTGDERDEDTESPDGDSDEEDPSRGLRKLKWFNNRKISDDEDTEGDAGHARQPSPQVDVTGAPGEPDALAVEKTDGGQGESWYAALARWASNAKQDQVLARRRILAAKWAVGAGIGYAFNLDQYVTDLLSMTEVDPGKVVFGGFFLGGAYVMWKAIGKSQSWLQPALKSVGDIIASFGNVLAPVPLAGPVVVLVTNLFHAVFTNYVPFRVLATAVGGWFAAPWAFVAVGYAQAHGIDMTKIGPHAVGLATAAGSWWLIDRRTGSWCKHWPGTVAHVLSHLPTGTLLLATALYRVS